MDAYLFTDLDDTLFQTLRKCGVPAYCAPENAAAYGLKVGAWSRDGLALSYLVPRQQRFLSLFESVRIIPVTARNIDAFRRVALSWPHGAVLNYGGTVLLPDGQEDLTWAACMRDRLVPWQEALKKLEQDLLLWTQQQHLDVRIRIIGQKDGNFYLVVKNTDTSNCVLSKVKQAGEAMLENATDWHIHHNDNNLAFIPSVLNKAFAVQYFMDTYITPLGTDYLSIGMGDSIVDIDFMNICDYSITPRRSQIQRTCLNGCDIFRKL